MNTRALGRVARAVATWTWAHRYDGLTLAGAGFIAWGFGLIFTPAGVMAAGLVIGAWGAIGSWTVRRRLR